MFAASQTNNERNTEIMYFLSKTMTIIIKKSVLFDIISYKKDTKTVKMVAYLTFEELM